MKSQNKDAARTTGGAPTPEDREYPVYVMLKCLMYDHVRSMASGSLNGQTDSLRQLLPAVNARRVHKSVMGKQESKNEFMPAVLHGVTPHYFQTRFEDLAKRGILRRSGHGLRNSVLYEWVEPITSSNMESFRALGRTASSQYGLALDLSALAGVFSNRPFTFPDFLMTFQEQKSLADNTSRYRPILKKTGSSQYREFLRGRFETAIRCGLLRWNKKQARLSRSGMEAIQWAELLVHNVQYK